MLLLLLEGDFNADLVLLVEDMSAGVLVISNGALEVVLCVFTLRFEIDRCPFSFARKGTHTNFSKVKIIRYMVLFSKQLHVKGKGG